MTLCAAWIRQAPNGTKELVFATDSMLTGSGETWKHGIKLFALPRKDCLLCFAGETEKAYPLILNLQSALRFNNRMLNPHTGLRDMLQYLCDTFTEIINSLNYELGDTEGYNPYTAAKFIFGGWNWETTLLEFWEITYGIEEKRFLYQGQDSTLQRAYIMIGDHLDEAADLLHEELIAAGKRITGAFDMEPFSVLSRMARNTDDYRPIDGALQIAKVYQSGSTEFFGVMWPSVNGKPTFLSRELNPYSKPQIRFIDPDTGAILDLELPKSIIGMDIEIYGEQKTFIESCYPDGAQKPSLKEGDKEMLLAIFKDNSYKTFLAALTPQEGEPQPEQES